MTQWPESVIQKTKSTILMQRYVRLNGKVIFKNRAGERAFMYEAEIDKGLYRLYNAKKSSTFTHYESVEKLMADGWVLA